MLNYTEKNYDDMTREELEQELREAFLDTDTIDESLNDELEEMREILNRKWPMEYVHTPEESLARFLENNAELFSSIESVPNVWETKPAEELRKSEKKELEGAQTSAVHLRSASSLVRKSIIAAVIVALLAGTVLAADSLGLWAWVPKWNATTERYEPAATEASWEGPILETLAKMGITESVYPAKLPDGFVITESRISEDPLVLMEQYARGDKRLSIIITPIKGFETVVYQKAGGSAQEYVSGKVVRYAFETENTVTAIWYTKHYATTISGNITREEIKGIIDSIHEGAA